MRFYQLQTIYILSINKRTANGPFVVLTLLDNALSFP